jgi:hypothetical protein
VTIRSSRASPTSSTVSRPLCEGAMTVALEERRAR